MELIIFDLIGKYAHFRKFYTNSSSLSYSVPPRTVLSGIIGAVLGLERDSYYEMFSSEKLNVAVKKMGRTRRIMQTLNYVKATSPGEIMNIKDHTQIPFELIAGYDNVRYRVYACHTDERLMAEFVDRLKNNKPVYPPYLGSATFNCRVHFIGKFEATEEKCSDFVPVSTVINQDLLEEKGIDINGEIELFREKMPREFGEGRTIKQVASYIFEESGRELRVKLKGSYFKVNDENIVFL
jgi:CRISPR-associated protein Cas5h